MQHCSGVAAATTDIASMDEGIVEEGIVAEETVDVETIEEVGYGETGFLDGSSSTQETKKFVGCVQEFQELKLCIGG